MSTPVARAALPAQVKDDLSIKPHLKGGAFSCSRGKMAVAQALRTVLGEAGLPTGTSLEDRITWRLHMWSSLDQMQYPVAGYRLDYAWPEVRIGLEVDGPMHRTPEGAARDVLRDTVLRREGWIIFRIDDLNDNIEEQLSRAVRMVRQEISPHATCRHKCLKCAERREA